MILDSKSFNIEKRYDVCIIGAGIVGIATANELKDNGLQICVIESADGENDAKVNQAKELEYKGLSIKESSRERALGGTSKTWWGLSGLFDRLDLEKQEHIPYSGWPIGYEEILEYCKRASKKYSFPPTEVYFDEKNTKLPIFEDQDSLQPEVLAACVEPTRFWDEYRSIFEKQNVDLIKGLTVTELVSVKESKVDLAKCKDLSGTSYEVFANNFILASGGIENPRILLNSKNTLGTRLGNEYDQVGRYFMNHPKGYCGEIKISAPKKFKQHFLRFENDLRIYTGISLSANKRKKEKLLHSYIQLEPKYPWTGDKNFNQFMNFIKSRHTNVGSFDLFKSIVLASPKICRYYLYKLTGIGPTVKCARVRNYLDMAPRPERRVILTEQKDIFGVPIPKVIAHITDEEKGSLIALHKEIDTILKEKGMGSFKSGLDECKDWPVVDDASHHMGTTRMGEDPKTSVVDKNLKVHECANLYVVGTSVFPTGGCVNPTLTAAALAVRFTEYLSKNVYGLTDTGIGDHIN